MKYHKNRNKFYGTKKNHERLRMELIQLRTEIVIMNKSRRMNQQGALNSISIHHEDFEGKIQLTQEGSHILSNYFRFSPTVGMI